ncbi:MAG: antibiotic biosynthesis monooxygenase [Myxococcota bacterium]
MSTHRSSVDRTDAPATVVLTRIVRQEHEAEFEARLAEHLEEVTDLPGHLGMSVFRPVGGDRTWSFVFRFDSWSHLETWQHSDMKRRWEDVVAPLTEGEPRTQIETGLETWFSTAGLSVVAPPARWKIAITTWIAIYPTITLLLLLVDDTLAPLPIAIRTLLLTGMLVPLMTFALMPFLSQVMRRWLYPSHRADPTRVGVVVR